MSSLWKNIRTIITVICVFFLFFFLIEIIRAYQTLYQLHPFFAILFIILLCCGSVWLFTNYFKDIFSKPPVLIPPKIEDLNTLSSKKLCHYGKYLNKYLDRLANNENLSHEERKQAKSGIVILTIALNSKDDREAIYNAIKQTEEKFIKPLLNTLDEQAEGHIQNSVRDVMLGTILSPYKAADLLIVLYRNLVMVKKITTTYNSRPRFREHLRIMLDTITVVATVNFINMGKNVMECLGSIVPFVGKYIDDIAQGIGAGLMTSVAGHSAIRRCQAFKGWDEQEAKQHIRSHISVFYGDIINIFKEDVWEKVKKVSGVPIEKIGNVKDSILEALDEAGKGVIGCVKKPANVVTSGVSGGNTLIKNVGSKIHTAGSKLYEGAKEKSPVVAKKFKVVGSKGLSVGKSGFRVIGKGLSVSGKYAVGKTSKIVSSIKNRGKKAQESDETIVEDTEDFEEQI
jgi:hypothetical protein